MRGYLSFLVVALALNGPSRAEDKALSGTEVQRLMGKDARLLIQMLGQPSQDIREGAGRRLQFASDACILDVYLYPAGPGATPVSTYMAARVLDGREAERNSCIIALRQRR